MTSTRGSGGGWRRACAALAIGLAMAMRAAGSAPSATPQPITTATSPTPGPAGIPIAPAGPGHAAGTTYGLCILPAGKDKCGYEGANLIGGTPAEQFTAAGNGTIPAITAIIPDLVPGEYQVVSFSSGVGTILAR